MSTTEAAEDASEAGIPKRYFSSLVRWYWPFTKPHRGLLVLASLAMLVVLGAQSLIPLVISDILRPPVGGLVPLLSLGGLIVLELVMGNLGERATFNLTEHSGRDLRVRLFEGLLSSRYLAQPRLARSSVVSRFTSDVDNVSRAVESTILKGVPGVVLVLVSLVLLSYVDWRSGVAMALVTVGFLIARAKIGGMLLADDRARLDASSRVGEIIDETVTMAVPIAGLRMERPLRSIFYDRVVRLERASYRQSLVAGGLGTVANAAGLLGLLIVIVSAGVGGQQQFATVAAALLYITNIVSGLARLPPWVRDLQLAVVSRRRIEQVLHGAKDSPVVREALATPSWYELASTQESSVGLVGLVTPPHVDDDHVLTAMTGTPDESAWRVTLFGAIVRQEGVRPDVLFVPDEPLAFHFSMRDHFRAVDAEIADGQIVALLHDVGLRDLAGRPDVLEANLGGSGAALTSHDRARLLLAMAIAAQPRLLLLGALPPLADIDTAAPLFSALAKNGCHNVVVAVRTPEVAAAMDQMMYVDERRIQRGTHTELLARCADYSHLWSTRLLNTFVDLEALGLQATGDADLHARLVSEHFRAGEVIYRQGDAADRVLFIISGRVEITVAEGGGSRRVAVLGPGNHCGDLHLTARERRAETAVAIDECVVRSLSRGAYTAGMMGILDSPAVQRRIVVELLRGGPCSVQDLPGRLPGTDPEEIHEATRALLEEGMLTQRDAQLRVVHRRRANPGLADIHQRLLDL
jgi:ABC-type multidrug transport system fused ATPase/permease subunit